MLPYYSDEPGSQTYPSQLDNIYPNTGNFIGFVANMASRLLKNSAKAFQKTSFFPLVAVAAPESIMGVDSFDQLSFWQEGYHTIMVTDTVFLRYPLYHLPSDTPDKLDYIRMAEVVSRIGRMLETLFV